MRVWGAAMLAALVMPGAASAGTVFLLDGGGWGHGVGMSQWGAEGYARHGYDYKRILAHDYPHTTVATAADRDVRVLLDPSAQRVVVGSTMPFLVVDARGKKVHVPAGNVAIHRFPVVAGRHLLMPLSIRAGAAPLTVDGAGYRGDLTIRATAGGLETVNVVTLEHYLWGVVPWEVPRGWQTATYEAQAVAARSYALATLHSTADFDLYADDRSQMYGGIRAERPETSYAVNATVGQVLTYSGAIIPAYYFSTSGGWTEAVHAAWPRLAQVPYLVAVPDPFDWISPRHRWPTRVVTPVWLAQRLGLAGVRDAFVTKDSGGRVAQLHLLGPHGWVTFAGNAVRQKLHLRSTFFRLRRLTLDAPARRVLATSRVLVRGSVRGLQHAQLQELVGGAWRIVSYLRVRSNGSFEVALRGRPTMRLRLVAENVPGDVVTYRVAR